ncbi:AzlC family ABC transporter permease [Oceanimonas pelagia]|uniref:AzlC family ABC transporter permease n=1 Tax=Oceanimonas pelagia TaxID=3028314 RepID=A0AA50KRJ7_9GAMM|nr:AzlC family ABC transporter permease [Oceanimonas pelagia]WMC11657.1 AzlC family ABC transporter permease [Oceanimonas pelagia]
MTTANTGLYQLDGSLIWSGFRQLAPISVFVTVFGAAFGLAAKQKGLSDTSIIAMSALAFSGYAQFALLEQWGAQIPLFAMLMTALAINARHLLMGATLYPWLCRLTPAKRYGVMLLASDANWAMSMRAFSGGRPGFGLLLGGGLALWFFWVSGTWLGVYFGNAISHPERLGLDMVMGCFLLAMAVGGEKSPRMLIIWLVAALSSLLAYWYLPDNSHVLVGALAGGMIGTVWGTHDHEH